ncbi:MAG: phage major capsid protein [Opitutaceae bacterium]|jgi:chromosome segregation ATPase|nr:phage major capsid protein [Opitutaceae bacterium]
MKTVSKLILHTLAGLFLASAALAQQPDAAAQIELRLREALRATTLQLRTAQTELAALQLVKDEIEKERDAFKKELAVLKKLAEAERAASEKTVDGLNKRLEEKDTKIAELTATGDRWKKTAEDTHALAQKLDAERNRLEIANAELERRAADREAKNVALVRLSQEILTRLERFGLGDALTAREPFVRTKRVELQTLVQDYADRITDNKAAR